MSREDAAKIMEQVWFRYSQARLAFTNGAIEAMDKELSGLRDLLDDVYDRPDEKLIEPDPAAGR